jgi:hypothetical protein
MTDLTWDSGAPSSASRPVYSDPSVFLNGLREEVQRRLLEREQIYNQIRQTGETAPAEVLRLVDTGIRIGNEASMIHLDLQVFPEGKNPFRSETQNAISDATRHKFMPGCTVYIKYDPKDLMQVALDRAADTLEPATIVCPHCGAAQMIRPSQANCSYCGRRLEPTTPR